MWLGMNKRTNGIVVRCRTMVRRRRRRCTSMLMHMMEHMMEHMSSWVVMSMRTMMNRRLGLNRRRAVVQCILVQPEWWLVRQQLLLVRLPMQLSGDFVILPQQQFPNHSLRRVFQRPQRQWQLAVRQRQSVDLVHLGMHSMQHDSQLDRQHSPWSKDGHRVKCMRMNRPYCPEHLERHHAIGTIHDVHMWLHRMNFANGIVIYLHQSI